MFIKHFIAIVAAIVGVTIGVSAQSVDYSVVSVPEESGLDIMQVSSTNDYVSMPAIARTKRELKWNYDRVLDVSYDGKSIAYISNRNGYQNIFIKELGKQGGAIQRTNRKTVVDFSYSPDGKQICFSENRGSYNQIFLTDASNGYVCRQITSANIDASPMFSRDMKQILFARKESNSMSIWGYNINSNFISSYVAGDTPYSTGASSFLCTRSGVNNRGEIWRIDYSTGIEECIVSDPERSFASPVVSPNGQWILFVGESVIETDEFKYRNTDIYACRIDGTELMQITYHAADDVSPVWSRDGKYIYFISQRGNANATPNIWRLTFQYY